MKREFATLRRHVLETIIVSEVRVIARAEGYAMVRHKGAIPFVVDEKQLEPIEPGTAQQEARHD